MNKKNNNKNNYQSSKTISNDCSESTANGRFKQKKSEHFSSEFVVYAESGYFRNNKLQLDDLDDFYVLRYQL